MIRSYRLPSLSSRSLLIISRSAPPPRLPPLLSHTSWHNRESGWLRILSLRLPGLWLLLLRSFPSKARLRRLGLPHT